jgi:hypothetical protein
VAAAVRIQHAVLSLLSMRIEGYFPSLPQLLFVAALWSREGRGKALARPRQGSGATRDRQTDRVGERIYRILSIVRVPVPLAVPCPLFVSRVLPESLRRTARLFMPFPRKMVVFTAACHPAAVDISELAV